MEAGKDDKEEDVAPQVGEESAAQPGTPSGDLAAATGEQGVPPIPAEGTAAQEGPREEIPVAAPEGKEKTEAAQTRQEEAPAEEAAAEDPAALPAEVAALLNSPGMVETLQRMVAEATAKAQTREAAKVVREMAERMVDRQAREHELALKKAKSRQAALEQERKATQDEVRRLGSQLHQTQTALQEEREAKEMREQALAPVEKPRTEEPRTSSPTRAPSREEMHPKEGEWQAVTCHGQKGKGQPQGEPSD